jgi:succinylglutamate desuccinylase
MYCYYAEKGSGYKPKLVVEYLLGQPIAARRRGRLIGGNFNQIF